MPRPIAIFFCLSALFVHACGTPPPPTSNPSAIGGVVTDGETYLYWLQPSGLFRAKCQDPNDYDRISCSIGVQSADYEAFKAALALEATDFERTIRLLESRVTYTIPLADRPLLDKAFRAALSTEN